MGEAEVLERLRADGEIISLRREASVAELRDAAAAVDALYTRISNAHSGCGLSPWAEAHLGVALAALQTAARHLELGDLEQTRALAERMGGAR